MVNNDFQCVSYRCLLRVIDSFGTEASFNHAKYARAHKKVTSWGMNDLHLQQYFTMFRQYLFSVFRSVSV